MTGIGAILLFALLLSAISVAAARAENSPDRHEPVARLEARAQAGDPLAQFELARAYSLAEVVEFDPTAQMTWLQRAADQGHGPALLELGCAYLDGDVVPVDRDAARRTLQAAAAAGEYAAFVELAEMHKTPDGSRADLVTAYMWYRALGDYLDREAEPQLIRFDPVNPAITERYRARADAASTHFDFVLSRAESREAQARAGACVQSGFARCD